MPHHSPQRDFALAVVHKLRAAGFEALWAGGCVRDELLGLVPKDYDVATNATPDQVRDLFGPRRTFAIGAAFGVITVLGPRAAGQIEVATFRTDAEYSDGRRPDSVAFTTAEHDAQRRDFTINGLFFDPVANEVVDYVGGRADLERKLIRAIGDPRMRLSEDKLRMLRAVRFAATFGFEIEPATLRAIQEMAAEVNTVSAERIGMELRRMLVHPGRVHALDLLREAGLLDFVLPEVAAYVPAAWEETRRELGNLGSVPIFGSEKIGTDPLPTRGVTLPLALAALLRQAGDPAVMGTVGRRLRFPTREHERATWLLTHVGDVQRALELPWPQLQRLLVHDGGPELVALAEAIVGPDDPAIMFCRERLAWPDERLNPRPLVDGSDLIGHGLAPSPDFARLLEAVRDAQLMGKVATTDEALALVQRLLAEGLDANA